MNLLKILKIAISKSHREKEQLAISSSVDRVLTIDGNSVAVGKFSYGMQNIDLAYHQGCPTLSISRYCSIAGNVRIFLGAYHRSDWVSTYPFSMKHEEVFGKFETPGFPKSNGPVFIGNDVWIGNSATIMSGVKIGDGAVIAAGAHVIKDVLPYEIVGGNPAKHIQYRFSKKTIEKLLKICWWNFPNEVVSKIAPGLCCQPNNDFLDELIETYGQ